MKVLHLPFVYYPDPVGGTEVYVASLVRKLRSDGIEPVVAAPGLRTESYEHAGVRVYRFAGEVAGHNLRFDYGEGDPVAAEAFARILDKERPDAVHLHALSPAVSLRLVRLAKTRGAHVFFTYHTPTVTCQRGTLLKWGSAVCDGSMNSILCSACSLHGLGVPKVLAQVLARLPPAVSACPGRIGCRGALWTAWRIRELVELRHRTTRQMLSEVDAVVAVCDWVKQVLLRNGVLEEKITVSRQGLCQDPDTIPALEKQRFRAPGDPLKVVFLGRFHRTKGVDILMQAVQAMPDRKIVLDVFGVRQGEKGDDYVRGLRHIAAADPRITLRDSIPADLVVEVLSDYDLLAVPSQWLESGPMVVLEAFAAGVPVIGSRLGGLAEIVRDGVDGVLVNEPHRVVAWTAALGRLAGDNQRLAELRRGISAPRTMRMVAHEMAELYGRVRGEPRRYVAPS